MLTWKQKSGSFEGSQDEEGDEGEYSEWAYLPDLLLEQIFQYLTVRERYNCSLVCRSWNRAFYLPRVWSRFVLEDDSLTRAKFNYYSGWQYVLDHLRTQLCLQQVGKFFRHLTFDPMLNFYNLYEFMNMTSWFLEQKNSQISKSEVGKKIRSLKFTFPCSMSRHDDTERIRLFGTGGKLLEALKRLMENLTTLKNLELIDLMLDSKEAQFLLDGVCSNCCLTLRRLALINTTRLQYQLLHPGTFLNLEVLVISPQNLGDELIELLGFTRLRHLHILQNRYSPSDIDVRVPMPKSWKECRKNNPSLRVHLQLECNSKKELVWQQGAPVKTVLYNSSFIGVNTENVVTAIDLYKNTLRIYGHQNLPRTFRPKSFHARIDGALLLLCRQSPALTVLIITERISTATLLLIACTAKNLRQLHVRRNAVIKRNDWPKNPEWADDFYEWIRKNSRSYDSVERELSQVFGRKWRMLSDRQFKALQVNMHDEDDDDIL